MEGAFAWLSQLVEWFGRFVPRLSILDTTENAVKYVRGKRPVALGPGLHVWWPLVTTWVPYPVARQADELRTQTIVTTDDKVIVVGGLLVYEVIDIVKLVAYTHSPSGAVTDIALTAVHDTCCQLSWSELKDEQRRGTLDTKLKNSAQKALGDYGVRVMKLMLTDLAPCRVLKLMQHDHAGMSV
jgi:regulator of protease activity HflC (stomatin/prohibitin superfamily)